MKLEAVEMEFGIRARGVLRVREREVVSLGQGLAELRYVESVHGDEVPVVRTVLAGGDLDSAGHSTDITARVAVGEACVVREARRLGDAARGVRGAGRGTRERLGRRRGPVVVAGVATTAGHREAESGDTGEDGALRRPSHGSALESGQLDNSKFDSLLSQRNCYIENVVLFEENSILPLPERLESPGCQFLKVEVSQESHKNR